MTVELRLLTDPLCPWSWASEPKRRRLAWEFGESLNERLVMGGLARRYGPAYRDEEGAIGSGPDCFADLITHWLDVAAETGMPLDPRLWTRGRPTSSYPACIAVKAATEQGNPAASRYLRRIREGLFLERRKLDHPEALVAEAETAGLDVERFRLDLSSNAILEAFGADLDEAREIPEQARAEGAVKRTEERERVSFPTAVFVAPDASRRAVFGWQPYEAYRRAALDAGATPAGEPELEPLAAIERFGRCAPPELEALTGHPRPVLEAELWALAREWRLRPVPALTGTMWERA